MDTESQRLLVLHRKRWKDGKQCDGRRLLDQQMCIRDRNRRMQRSQTANLMLKGQKKLLNTLHWEKEFIDMVTAVI